MKNLSTEAKALKNAYQREWRKKNPEKARAHTARYWERKAAETEAAENRGEQNERDKEH